MHQTLATAGCAVSERVTAQDGGVQEGGGIRPAPRNPSLD